MHLYYLARTPPCLSISRFPPATSKPSPYPLALILPQLDHKRPPLNRIHQNIPTLKEWIMTPRPHKIHHTSIRLPIILGIHIKIPRLLDPRTGRIPRQAPNIQHPEPSAVVALVREAIDDELVVVDAGGRALVEACLFRGLERADVPDVGDGVAGGGGALAVGFVEFVVEEEEFLPGGVGYPALVRVCGG